MSIIKCDKCNKTFIRQGHLDAHINKKKSCVNNIYQCKHCIKSFTSKNGLANHIEKYCDNLKKTIDLVDTNVKINNLETEIKELKETNNKILTELEKLNKEPILKIPQEEQQIIDNLVEKRMSQDNINDIVITNTIKSNNKTINKTDNSTDNSTTDNSINNTTNNITNNINKTKNTINVKLTRKYVEENFLQGPILKRLDNINTMIDYSIDQNKDIEFNSGPKTDKEKDKYVRDLIAKYHNGRMIEFLGDYIVKIYKTTPPEQAMWATDTSRSAFTNRRKLDDSTETVWVKDPKGKAIIAILILPVLVDVKKLVIRYINNLNLETQHEEARVCNIINGYLSKKVAWNAILNYITPYFALGDYYAIKQ